MFYLLTATFIWAFSFGLIGNLLGDLPSAWLAAVRVSLAALAFIPFTKRTSFSLALPLMAIGAVQFGLMSLTYMASFKYLQSHEVALFTVMTPVYVVLASDLFQHRFCGRHLGVALLAVGGAALILWRGGTLHVSLIGFGLVELSNLCFAVGQIAYREVLKRQAQPLVGYQHFWWLYLGGSLVLWPFGAYSYLKLAPQPTMLQAGVLLYLGIVVSGFSYFCWNSGARRVTGPVLAVMNNLKIPLSILVSLWLFHEKVQIRGLLAGSLLLLAALWLAFYAKKQAANA